MGVREVNLLQNDRQRFSIEEWYSCRRKRGIEDEGKAQARADLLNRNRPVLSYVFKVYHCHYCGLFHVGREWKRRGKGAQS